MALRWPGGPGPGREDWGPASGRSQQSGSTATAEVAQRADWKAEDGQGSGNARLAARGASAGPPCGATKSPSRPPQANVLTAAASAKAAQDRSMQTRLLVPGRAGHSAFTTAFLPGPATPWLPALPATPSPATQRELPMCRYCRGGSGHRATHMV